MTVISQVKQCVASLRGVQSNLQTFALQSEDDTEQRTFHESMLQCENVLTQLQNRVFEMEKEEPEYKGN